MSDVYRAGHDAFREHDKGIHLQDPDHPLHSAKEEKARPLATNVVYTTAKIDERTLLVKTNMHGGDKVSMKPNMNAVVSKSSFAI